MCIDWNMFWHALSALGTVAAIIAALWLARSESNKHEYERKRDSIRHRNEFVENVLLEILKKAAGPRFKNLLTNGLESFSNSPSSLLEVSKLCDEVYDAMDRLVYFRKEEYELLRDELAQIGNYVEKYHRLLWEIRNLQTERREIKEALNFLPNLMYTRPTLERLKQFETDEEKRRTIDERLSMLDLNTPESFEKRLQDNLKEIEGRCDDIVKLSEDFPALSNAISDSTQKLEQRLENVHS